MSIEHKRIPLSQCALDQVLEAPIAFNQGQRLGRTLFCRDVAEQAAVLIHMDYALYYGEAYPFVVMLFALWHADKPVWIAANNRPTTAEKLLRRGCRLLGEWSLSTVLLTTEAKGTMTLTELAAQKSELKIFNGATPRD
jgi:hypothetical protein